MKTNRLSAMALLLGWCMAVSTLSQEPPAEPQASLVVVNAVPGDKNVFVSFDDQPIWPPGFTSGQSTSPVMFPAGKKKIKIECEGYATTEASLELPPGANCAMVIYPGSLIPEGPDKGKRQLAVFIPAPHKAGTKPLNSIRWKMVLIGSDKSQQLEVNGKAVNLSPRKSVDLAVSGPGLTVRHQNKDILGVAPEEPGEYWVAVYPNGEELSAVLLTHLAFKVPSN